MAVLHPKKLIDRFAERGIPLLKEQFRSDLMEHLDISKLSTAWREKYNPNLEDEEIDFIYVALELSTDVLKLLPNTDESNLLNYRKAIGETYGRIGDYLKADECFQSLTEEHPNWVWGYIGWGSLYTFKDEHRDLEKATRIFNIGLDRCKEDRDVLLERLNDL